jgi:hypothetical protein
MSRPEDQNPQDTLVAPVAESATPETHTALAEAVIETPPMVEAAVAEAPAVAPAIQAPVTEAPPVVEAAAAEPAAEPVLDVAELARQNTEQLNSAFTELLQAEEEDFAAQIKGFTVPELAIALEELGKRDINREAIRKAGQLKRQYDATFEAALNELRQLGADAPAESDGEASEEAPRQQSEAEKELLRRKNELHEQGRRFSAALVAFNKKRNAWETDQQKEKEENSKKKQAILDQLKEIVEKGEVQNINRVRHLQTEWRNIGPVLATDMENFFQTYRAYLDQFYELRQQYNELIDQDRKYNLEEKQRYLKEIDTLIPEDPASVDFNFWQQAVDRVKALHELWKTTGPVSRDISEQLWQDFKTATDKFYDARRIFFEKLDGEREENQTLKQQLIDRVKPYLEFSSNMIDEWRKVSEEVNALQAQFRDLGRAPKEIEQALNKEFRDIVDQFFDRRKEYFRELDEEKSQFIVAKEKLVEVAESLMNSENWRETSETLKQLQREWASTGPDAFRDARKLQKRFRKACDVFFKRMKDTRDTQFAEEDRNLKRKHEVLDRIEALTQAGEAAAREARDEVDQLVNEFEQLGRVPIKAKNSIQARYERVYDAYLKLALDDDSDRDSVRMVARFQKLRSQPGGLMILQREEKKLQGRIKQVDDSISQFENNMAFITKAKSGDKLRADMEGRIEEARQQRNSMAEQLKALRKIMKEEPLKSKNATLDEATSDAIDAANSKAQSVGEDVSEAVSEA